jgi:hypothetical protein
VTRIVDSIGMQFFRPATRAAKAASDRRDGVQQGLERRAVVLISRRDAYRQRESLAVDPTWRLMPALPRSVGLWGR